MESWIDTYLRYTERQVSPRAFHFWSAVAVLGGVMERKCRLLTPQTHSAIYPGQTMVVLVSKSALTKKTTAARMAVRFTEGLEPWQFCMLPRKLSPQSLLQALKRVALHASPQDEEYMINPESGKRVHSAGFLFGEELGALFTTEPFAEALATHINQLNDCPKGKFRVEFRSWCAELWQPCITMLGCITPTGLNKELPKAARTAGFFGRLILVYADHTDRSASLMEEPSPLIPGFTATLETGIRDIARMRGAFVLSPKAYRWHQEWYYGTYLPKLRQPTLPEAERSGYWNRKESHMLRTAMILSAAESRARIIRVRHLVRAAQTLADVDRDLGLALAELGTTMHAEFPKQLLEIIERLGPRRAWVREDRVRRAFLRFGGDRQFQEASDSLRAAGEAESRFRNGHVEWRRILRTGHHLRLVEQEQKGNTEGEQDERSQEGETE